MATPRKIDFFNADSSNKSQIDLFHGSDHIVEKPCFGFGREDNDYGSGFYTTRIYNKAVSWAKSMGNPEASFVNKYSIDTEKLKIVNLDNFGVLAWIAEIAAHRPIKSELSSDFLPDFVNKYKMDTSYADIIIGYRADDSYTDVIGAFCDGLITCDEVQRLFYKGNLGEQYFIKSELAFNSLHFVGADNVSTVTLEDEMQLEVDARNEVFRFLANRRLAVAKRFQVPPITIIDAISTNYHYNQEFCIYEIL